MNSPVDLVMDTKGYNLTRKEIIDGYKWREGLIPLRLSKHAQRRIEERILGEFVIVPSICRITEGNICSGRSKDGKSLSSVKIRLDYKKDQWMYLVICPWTGVVKTLYINYKNAKKEREARERQGIKERECCVEEGYYEEKGEISGTDSFREAGTGENVGILPVYMEEKTTFLRRIWSSLREFPFFV